MTASSTSRKLTYQDFLAFPDDGRRHELIDGMHYVTPSPVTPHQRVVGNLYFLIRLHLEQHGGGEIFPSPFDVVFSFFDVVEPDLLYVSDARKPIVTHKHVRGSPDLVIEVLSPATRRRDEGVKLALYDRSDVVEYWVIDPERETVRAYRRDGAHLCVATELENSADAELHSPLFPGMALPLRKLFGRQ